MTNRPGDAASAGPSLAYAQLALAMILVGANVGVAKLLAESLPIALIAFLRCALACLVLWPLARVLEGAPRLTWPIRKNLFWQAVFGTAIYNAGLLAGLRLTTALEGGLMLATLPAVVALGSFVLLRERLLPRQFLAAGVAGAGMAAITLARLGGSDGGSLLGNALIFLGVCGEAGYVLLAKRIAGRAPVITASLWMQLFSAAVLLPFAAPGFSALGELRSADIALLLVFHSLTASVLCLLLWYQGLKRVPAGIAGVFTAFLPASAAVTAVVFLGEHFSAVHAVGFVLMLVSMLLATWPARR